MKLLIDMGNTATKWARLNEGGLQDIGRSRHSELDLDDLWPQLWRASTPPEAIWAACVAGNAAAHQLQVLAQRQWGLSVTLVRAEPAAYGIRCAYADPGRLGPDRWAALIGARNLVADNVCVISAGTAITVDLLDAQGLHLGGLITPGLALMHQSLLNNTAQILIDETIRESTPEHWLGQDTNSAVSKGIQHTLHGFIKQMLVQLDQQWPQGYQLIMTGGDSAFMQTWLPKSTHFEPHLVLLGLAHMAQHQSHTS
jgi:type III pantothenate kinase